MIQWASALFLFAVSFSSFGEELGKPFIYERVVERWIGLDELVNQTEDFQVTHCEVVDKERVSQYEGLGSCIYKTIDLFEIGENSRDEKSIIVYITLLNEHLFEFQINWTTVTLAEFIFEFEEKQIDLLVEILKGSLEEFAYYLGLVLTDSPEITKDRELISALLEKGQREVTQLKLQMIPVEEGVFEIKLALLSSMDDMIYEHSSYYITPNDETEESFIVSGDIYFSEYVGENN